MSVITVGQETSPGFMVKHGELPLFPPHLKLFPRCLNTWDARILVDKMGYVRRRGFLGALKPCGICKIILFFFQLADDLGY
jgi:hypothetical protein